MADLVVDKSNMVGDDKCLQKLAVDLWWINVDINNWFGLLVCLSHTCPDITYVVSVVSQFMQKYN
jgi:hypothetical protein